MSAFSASVALPGRRPARSRFAAELVATLALAWPLVAANLAQVGLGTADVLLVGRLGPDALAAGALGTNLYFAFAFLGTGLVSATAPLMAEAVGRRRGAVRDVRRSVRAGLWWSVGVAVPVSAALWYGEAMLLATGQEPRLAAEAGTYLRWLVWGLAPFLGATVLRFFLAALGRPGLALVVALAGLPVNVGLAAWFIWGGAGVPPMGLPGAGLATALTSAATFAVLALTVTFHPRLRRWAVLGRFWKPDRARLARLWRLGFPIALTLSFEIGVFNSAALVVGWFGATALAAHAVALQIAATVFMIPLGIGQAATVRVGLARGAGDAAGVQTAGWAALALGALVMASTTLILLGWPRTLVELFVNRADPAHGEVIRLGVALLGLAALFQLADGLQAVAAGLLRGIQDTRVPMLLAGLGYWGVGAPLGLALALPGGLGPVGIWIGLATGLGVVAALLLARWWRRDRGRDGVPKGSATRTES